MPHSSLKRASEAFPPATQADVSRAAIRAVSDLFLSAAELAARLADDDLTLGIVWLTVVERGADRLRRSPEKWDEFIRSGGVRPDDKRPPVSVFALSRLLKFPYETTRRHVMRLIAMGHLVRVPGGVISPAAHMDSAKVRAASAELQSRLRRCLVGLERLGIVRHADPEHRWLEPVANVPDPYVYEERRKYSRIAILFVVEAAKLLAQTAGGDMLRGLLFLAIVQANIQQVSGDPALSRQYGSSDLPPPDALRRPISVYSLAQSLRIPYETARRHIVQLIDQGLVERLRAGVIVPTAVLMSPPVLAAMPDCYQLFRSFIQALSDAGMDIQMAA